VARLVALLRGINLGANRRIAMADLRELLSELGYEDPRTHLQSGNAVFETGEAPEKAARRIEQAIEERFGFPVDVMTRTADELAAVVAANPLGDVATDGAKHLVAFLSEAPDEAALARLAERDLGTDRFAVGEREVYVWCPDGVRNSQAFAALTAAKASPTATARNWNTVTKLLDMASPDAGD
jgi:uncharacterized protein (DUF1697 family)